VSDERDVIVVDVEDRPGTVAQVAGKLADAGVNIELAYTIFGGGLGSCLESTSSRRRGGLTQHRESRMIACWQLGGAR
jgi:ACT domain